MSKNKGGDVELSGGFPVAVTSATAIPTATLLVQYSFFIQQRIRWIEAAGC